MFFSQNQNISSTEEIYVNNAKNASDIKESDESIKEQVKEIVKTKDSVFAKKNTFKKEKYVYVEKNNKDKSIKNTKKTEFVKKVSSKSSALTEVAQSLKSDVLSSANGGSSLYTGTFFDNNSFKYPYYKKQIIRKVEAQCRWVESYDDGLRVLFYFKINRDGSVGDILVKESSGNEGYDKNALYAIRRASPFLELPEGYECETLGVFFEFNIKH
ncbi:MAG: TonB family protein [Endomicrobium sp.]|jgi:TonB family protein|nr:TonB family protein [Endomicrobium sp.]